MEGICSYPLLQVCTFRLQPSVIQIHLQKRFRPFVSAPVLNKLASEASVRHRDGLETSASALPVYLLL